LINRSKVAIFCVAFSSLTLSAAAQHGDARKATVMTLQSDEKGLGATASDLLRTRMSKDFSSKTLYTIPTKDVASYLESSGFTLEDPLSFSDEKTLATQVHADFYISGIVSHTSAGYHVVPRMVLSRDMTLAQPLPEQTAPKLEDAMAAVSKSVVAAARQLDFERQCIGQAVGGKVREAIAAASAGVAAYPQATLARMCAQNVYYDLYAKSKTHQDSLAYADSALAWSMQILQYDSTSVPPLTVAVELFRFRGDSARYLNALVNLVHADTSNNKRVEQVINELTAAHQMTLAQQLVGSLLERSPGDPNTLNLAFAVYSAANNWAKIATTGQEIAKYDTTAMDSLYFIRMGVAYNQTHETQKAVDLFAEGTAKHPKNATLWFAYSRALFAVGQKQQGNEALKKAVELDPKYAKQLLRPAQDFLDAKQWDSTYTAVQSAVASGADKDPASQIAMSAGGQLFRAANTSHSRDDFQSSIRFFELANQLKPDVKAQFFAGTAAFQIMQSAATEANKTKNCQTAQTANEAYQTAQTNLSAAEKDATYHDQASGMLKYLPQFKPAIASQLKNFCKQ